MSSSIWTRCAPEPDRVVVRLDVVAHRVVEGQHFIATRRLVDSDDEQDLLEQLLDASKPPPPPGFERLHYLLWTPFRYPPLRHGSRFGRRFERGLWYGAVERATALGEVAYYRLRFLEDTRANLGTLFVELSLFRVRVATDRGVDLGAPPFDVERERITDPGSYAHTQALGTELRRHGVAAALFPSARVHGTNVVVFEPAGFGDSRPFGMETWAGVLTRDGVTLRPKSPLSRAKKLVFRREQFLVDDLLPAPTA